MEKELQEYLRAFSLGVTNCLFLHLGPTLLMMIGGVFVHQSIWQIQNCFWGCLHATSCKMIGFCNCLHTTSCKMMEVGAYIVYGYPGGMSMWSWVIGLNPSWWISESFD